MRRVSVYLAVLASIAFLLLLGAPFASGQTGAQYVGSKQCEECHAEQWEPFQTNPHHMADLDQDIVADQVGCEGCHGPGSLHVEADGNEEDPRFATIRNFAKMKPDEAAAVCRTCHKTGEQFHWDQSAHARNDVKCQDCHSIHSPERDAGGALLKAAGPTQLCVRCHQDKRATLANTAHMPVREGAMSCADCHNPHGSAGPRMIRATSNNDLCTTCHMDKRGPFLWEHPPVREDCVTCHQPHGSNNDKVLAASRPFLCQRCHIATRHPSTLYDLPDLQQNKLMNRSCTNCHSQIHGSNHPSGEFLIR